MPRSLEDIWTKIRAVLYRVVVHLSADNARKAREVLEHFGI